MKFVFSLYIRQKFRQASDLKCSSKRYVFILDLFQIMSAGESGAAVALDTATQILATGNNISLTEFVEAVRNTSDNDVAKVGFLTHKLKKEIRES